MALSDQSKGGLALAGGPQEHTLLLCICRLTQDCLLAKYSLQSARKTNIGEVKPKMAIEFVDVKTNASM